jgi:hypothetical protein
MTNISLVLTKVELTYIHSTSGIYHSRWPGVSGRPGFIGGMCLHMYYHCCTTTNSIDFVREICKNKDGLMQRPTGVLHDPNIAELEPAHDRCYYGSI